MTNNASEKVKIPDNKEEVITLDEKQVALFKHSIRGIYLAADHLNSSLKEDSLRKSSSDASLSRIEYALKNLSEASGFESETAERIEERYGEIRKANETIAELNDKLAQANPNETLPFQLRKLTRNFESIIKRFLFAPDYRPADRMYFFAGYQHTIFKATICPNMTLSADGLDLLLDPSANSKDREAYLNKATEQGLVLKQGQTSQIDVIDSPSSRKWITDRILENIPSAEITEWKITRDPYAENKNETYIIRSISLEISDLTHLIIE